MKKFLFLVTSVFLVHIKCYAGSYFLAYGANFSEEPFTTLYFSDPERNFLDEEIVGILSVGFFDDGFDVLLASSRIRTDGIAPIISSFNSLHYTSSEFVTSPGFIREDELVNDLGIGKVPYFLLLTGITNIESALEAQGIGLFTDSSFASLPTGSDGIPSTHSYQTLAYDNIILGSSAYSTQPFPGNVYMAQTAIFPPLPLGTSENIFGYWWFSDWFGYFRTDTNTSWLYSERYGWVFPNTSSSSGLWFYEPSRYGWLFLSSQTYPNLWSNSQQKWLYLEERSPNLQFWEWNALSSFWELP